MGVEASYGGKGLYNRSPMCQSKEETTSHVLEGDKKFSLNDKSGKEWGKVVDIYRKNEENGSIDNISQEQNNTEKWKKREDSRRRQNLREDRRRQRLEKKNTRKRSLRTKRQ